jgi:CDP-paratose 2-epimerase
MQRVALVTGSSGLIGSEAVTFLDQRGWTVHGVDNNMRASFFGPDGDTMWNLHRLQRETAHFEHHEIDIRDRAAVLALFKRLKPRLILHCAAQPSHDLAKDRPFDDFDINAVGTLNLLEATRQSCAESPFVFMSTNKVYGDAPNERKLVELETRWEYADAGDHDGIDEHCRIDNCLHSLFGASKLAADILVQEYGRYFDMPTVCFRAGCLTGPNHSGAELHGFLAYLARCVMTGRAYRIYGYKGKQVRDNIHSYDVLTACLAFHDSPRSAAVYNLGGGRENSTSVLEAVDYLQELSGSLLQSEYVEQHRIGDHICYITNLQRWRADYPQWELSRSLPEICAELVATASNPTPNSSGLAR